MAPRILRLNGNARSGCAGFGVAGIFWNAEAKDQQR